MSELCRKHNVTPNTFYSWREEFIQGGKLDLAGTLKDPAKERDAEIERLKQIIAVLTIPNDAFKNSGNDREAKLMVANAINEAGIGLRDSLKYSGFASWSSYYCKEKLRFVKPYPLVVKRVKRLILQRSSYGTSRVSAQLSRDLGHPVSRKRIQRIFRILGYTQPFEEEKRHHSC